MKRALLISLLTVATAISARQLQIVDVDNMPIAAVCVTNDKGALVGKTDNDGLLKDTKDFDKLYFSHMAFQSKCVKLDTLSSDRIVLEDANYNLGEIDVKPKELIYVQNYYRVTYVCDDGPIYFRAGVVDNTFEAATKKISSKSRNISRAENGLIRFLINTFSGRILNEWAKIDTITNYDRILKRVNKGFLKLSESVNDRRIISDSVCSLGYVEDDFKTNRRTLVFDRDTYRQHLREAEEAAKIEKMMREGKTIKEKDKKKQDADSMAVRDSKLYEVYRIDDEGRTGVRDMIMRQLMVSGHSKRTDHDYVILIEVFPVTCDYIDKKDFKQTRKDNEVEMNIKELRNFEKNHNIPPLAPNLKEQIDLLFAKDLAK